MQHAIEADGLTMRFRDGRKTVRALDGVSFLVPAGQVVALLGPNGAGKTTLAKILSTLLLPTSGTARVLGYDVAEHPKSVRARMSVIFGGDRGLYGQLSAIDNLRYFAVLNGIGRKGLRKRLSEALRQVGLEEAGNREVQRFSRGMRQRLHIAIGMISEPGVIVLDEPTVGLDPIEAERLRGAIGELRQRGVTVLLTSHHLLDVERLADRVILIDKGVIVHDLPLSEFSRQAGFVATVTLSGLGDPPPLHGTHDAEPVQIEEDGTGWSARYRVRSWTPDVLAGLSAVLAATGGGDVRIEQVRLEDAFASVMEHAR
ncbi:MAG: ABC transporter ATP-binding protein [Streptomyces sp.]|nr:ABC transporter ATP-binding protein [Streptomyces sp.]